MTSKQQSVTGHSLFYYLLRIPGIAFPVEVPAGSVVFSYHRKSAMGAILMAFLMAATVEMTVVHYFLMMWNRWVAWVATLSSLWVVLMLVGQVRAIRCRPIFIQQGSVWLRNGMYELATIEPSNIKKVDMTSKTPVQIMDEEKPLNCCFPAGHNVVITLKKPREATLPFGQQRPFRVALVFVDEPRRFVARLSEQLPE